MAASTGGLSQSDLIGQPRWDRVAAYTERWADTLAVHPPRTSSEQVQTPSGLSLLAAKSCGKLTQYMGSVLLLY